MWRSHSLEAGLLKMGHTNMGTKMAMLSGQWSSPKMVNIWLRVAKTTSLESGQSCLRKKSDRRTRKKRTSQQRRAIVFD